MVGFLYTVIIWLIFIPKFGGYLYLFYISFYKFPSIVSKLFLDYLFCHLGEQMDKWIKHLTLLHSVDSILQSAMLS